MKHPILYRKASLTSEAELLIDFNTFNLTDDIGYLEPSPDGNFIAFGWDNCGNEHFSLNIFDVNQRKVLNRQTREDLGSFEAWSMFRWLHHSQGFVYTALDESGHAKKLFMHQLSSASFDEDELLYHEPEEEYVIAVSNTSDEKYLLLLTSECNAGEVWFRKNDGSNGAFTRFLKRKKNVLYWIEHHNDFFYIGINDNAPNFVIYQCRVTDYSDTSKWRIVLNHSESIYRISMDCFVNHIVVYEQSECKKHIRIIEVNQENEHNIEFNDGHRVQFTEEVYTYSAGNVDDNRGAIYYRDKSFCDYHSHVLTFTYWSLVTPKCIIEYDMNTKKKTIVYQQEVLNFDPNQYIAQRLFAPSRDQRKMIPISIIYKKDSAKPRPMLM
jgi:oligopeptidase B